MHHTPPPPLPLPEGSMGQCQVGCKQEVERRGPLVSAAYDHDSIQTRNQFQSFTSTGLPSCCSIPSSAVALDPGLLWGCWALVSGLLHKCQGCCTGVRAVVHLLQLFSLQQPSPVPAATRDGSEALLACPVVCQPEHICQSSSEPLLPLKTAIPQPQKLLTQPLGV